MFSSLGRAFVSAAHALFMNYVVPMLPELVFTWSRDIVPPSQQGNFRLLFEWVTMLDDWFAFVLLLQCVVNYLSFRIQFLIFKMCLKVLPFIG
jgi:hypothetical protein